MSRVIKSQWAAKQRAGRLIEIKSFHNPEEDEQRAVAEERPLLEAKRERAQIIEEAQNKAQALIEEAQRQQQAVLKQLQAERVSWEQERQSYVDQAYQEGYMLGVEEGRQAGYHEFHHMIEEAKEIVNQSKIEFEHNVHRSEKVILDLAIKSAEKILGIVLEQEPERFLSMIKKGLKENRAHKEIQIHVNPGQYELVVRQKEELESLFPAEIQLYIYPNEELADNACYIETKQGRIDASIDSQLAEIRKQLFEILEGEEA